MELSLFFYCLYRVKRHLVAVGPVSVGVVGVIGGFEGGEGEVG